MTFIEMMRKRFSGGSMGLRDTDDLFQRIIEADTTESYERAVDRCHEVADKAAAVLGVTPDEFKAAYAEFASNLVERARVFISRHPTLRLKLASEIRAASWSSIPMSAAAAIRYATDLIHAELLADSIGESVISTSWPAEKPAKSEASPVIESVVPRTDTGSPGFRGLDGKETDP